MTEGTPTDDLMRQYLDGLPPVTGLIEGRWDSEPQRPLGAVELRIWLEGRTLLARIEPWGIPLNFITPLPGDAEAIIREELERRATPILARIGPAGANLGTVPDPQSRQLLAGLRGQHTEAKDGAGIAICARCLEAWPCEHLREIDALEIRLLRRLQTARMLAHDAQRGYEEAHITMGHAGYFRACTVTQCRLARALVVEALELPPMSEEEGNDGTI